MKRSIGWILTILGLVVACVGLYLALRPVLAMYSAAMDDALSDSVPDDGKAIARNMIPGIVTMVVGVVMLLIGKLLLGIALIQRMRSKKH